MYKLYNFLQNIILQEHFGGNLREKTFAKTGI